MRVLFWVQHLLGSGHVGRALVLSSAMSRHGLEVTLVSGGGDLPWLARPDLRLVRLPAVRAVDPTFSRMVDDDGRPVGEALWRERRRRLLDLLDELRPAVVITEMFPFGRRAFRSELLPLLERAGALGASRIASVRDVLVEKGEADRYRWMRDCALSHYDLILAHTDRLIIPFGLTFPFRDDLGERLIETGFVGPAPAPCASRVGRGEILVSTGGGRVGRTLLAAALDARALVRSTAAAWRLIASGEDEAAALAQRPRPHVIIDRQRPDFRDLLANSLLSISQAGYNTVVEALAYEKRMVLVPFEDAGETEQRTRALKLAGLGLATLLPAGELGPRALAAAVDACLNAPEGERPAIDLAGADRSARLVLERARGRERRR
ncbi:MAG TPA: glycosyltransferase [Geminicoccaceae bacterium]